MDTSKFSRKIKHHAYDLYKVIDSSTGNVLLYFNNSDGSFVYDYHHVLSTQVNIDVVDIDVWEYCNAPKELRY
jgi:hypothetical protein